MSTLRKKHGGLSSVLAPKLTPQLNATASYDANGNQTQTTFASNLIYDANHHAVSSGGTAMTYDGLGRLEGIGTSTQVIWGPSGEKLGYLVSGTLVSSLKLPGGGEASYNGSSLTAVRHKDWLGSSRPVTTWSHGILSKTAYAPFGETYNTSGRADGDFTGMTEDAFTLFPILKIDNKGGEKSPIAITNRLSVKLRHARTFAGPP